MRFLTGLVLFALLAGPLAAATERGLIWRVDTGGAPSWLVGSLHLAPAGLYPLPTSFDRAVAETDTLVLEADVRASAMAEALPQMMAAGMLSGETSLADRLGARRWEQVAAAAEDVGVPPLLLQRQQPWLAAQMLLLAALSDAGWSAERGIERHLLRQDSERPVIELEGYAAQLELLADMPAADQEHMLMTIAESPGAAVDSTRRLAAAWQRGDAEAFQRRAGEDATALTPLLRQRLIDERNATMTGRIAELLRDGRRHLIVVGAAHMTGDGGIVERLRDRGYRVEQR